MILIAKAVTFSSRSFSSLRNIHDDALYRGSLYLLANNVATSAIGLFSGLSPRTDIRRPQ